MHVSKFNNPAAWQRVPWDCPALDPNCPFPPQTEKGSLLSRGASTAASRSRPLKAQVLCSAATQRCPGTSLTQALSPRPSPWLGCRAHGGRGGFHCSCIFIIPLWGGHVRVPCHDGSPGVILSRPATEAGVAGVVLEENPAPHPLTSSPALWCQGLPFSRALPCSPSWGQALPEERESYVVLWPQASGPTPAVAVEAQHTL